MSLKNKEIISVLNDLIEVSKDGEQGYKDAADDVKDPDIKRLLFKYSEQRGIFYSKLQYLVAQLGGEVEFSGSILGILHRRWMDIRFGIAGSKTEAILTECLRGEKAALSAYKKALERDMPENIKEILKKQYDAVSEAFQNIIQLSSQHGFEINVSADF